MAVLWQEPDTMEHEELTIHGRRLRYRLAGRGPLVLLIHGMAGSATTWKQVMPALSERFAVLAPDLLGHGESDKTKGDYSLGAMASEVNPLLRMLTLPGSEAVLLVACAPPVRRIVEALTEFIESTRPARIKVSRKRILRPP